MLLLLLLLLLQTFPRQPAAATTRNFFVKDPAAVKLPVQRRSSIPPVRRMNMYVCMHNTYVIVGTFMMTSAYRTCPLTKAYIYDIIRGKTYALSSACSYE